MDRETKTIKTPVTKTEVVLKTYLTGGEKREIRNIFLVDAELSSKGKEQEITGIKGNVLGKAENKAVELVVVSVGGKAEEVAKQVFDLPSKDTDFVMKEINKVSGDEDFLAESGR